MARNKQQHFTLTAKQYHAFQRGNLVCGINNDLAKFGYAKLGQDQIECMCDGTRAAEALAMVEDLYSRCYLSIMVYESAKRFIDTCKNSEAI
jgi:hypothetical protein